MPKRKTLYPYRKGVRHNANDDGQWSMVHIQRVEGDEIEEYTCMMPRYYAVPLILMNKRLAFLEASCRPDGTPLLPPTDDGGVKQSDTREYAYLWRVRTRFLQAVFDMNHERRLDEHWRYHGIHGFVYRLYRRYGHDLFQRHVYWRDEIKAGRVPYATPDIADMDWDGYILEDMAAARFNAFLWNRMSQGYDRVVKDAPPHESWRAWRRGTSRDTKPALYRSTPSPAARPGAASVAEEQAQSQSQPGAQSQSQSQPQLPSGPPRDVQGVIELEGQGPRAEGPVAATERTSERAAAAAAAGPAGCRAGNDSNRDEEDDDDAMDYEEVLTVVLIGPPHTQVVDLPFPTSAQPPESASTSTSTPGRLIPHRVLLKFKAPENVKLAVIHCTFSSVEDVGKDFETELKGVYTSRVSS